MAHWRCFCGHYEEQHLFDKGPCCHKSFGVNWAPSCTCREFRGRGDSPEGTDIYREDDVSDENYPLRDNKTWLPGYHLTEIAKGTIGELSKVQEELDELIDAEEQGVKVMQLVEASDLIGALVRWLEAKHPGTTLEDLIAMHTVTRRAFENGRR